jgi:hypothetical protein
MLKLPELAFSHRLAVGLFLLSLVYFYGHAQWNLRVNVGQQAFPTADDVLLKYHGRREESRLEFVLDPRRNPKKDFAMYQYLDGDYEGPEVQRKRYEAIVNWVRAGSSESGWGPVAKIFTHPKLCGNCHAPGKEMAKVPLVTFADVKRFARMDTGLSEARLTKLSHSHLAGFALLAVVTSLIFGFTRYRPIIVAPLLLMVFFGPMIDVTGWWLTKQYGMPWPYLIMAGGALFGFGLMAMVALTLDELWLRSLFGRTLNQILRPLGLRIRE